MGHFTMLLLGLRSWAERKPSFTGFYPSLRFPQITSPLMFSFLSTCPAGDICALPSTVQIVNLELQDPPTDDKTTMTVTRTKTTTTDVTEQPKRTQTDFCPASMLTLYLACMLIVHPACKLMGYLALLRLMSFCESKCSLFRKYWILSFFLVPIFLRILSSNLMP